MNSKLTVFLMLTVVFLWATFAVAAPPVAHIKALGIPPAAGLVAPDSSSIVTAGLLDVGRGTYAFLEGIGTDPDGDSITAYTWALISQPTGSNATLDSIGNQVQSFVTDSIGLYSVTLVVTAGGENSAPDTVLVNASTWIGIGTIGGATPQYPQCGLCHFAQNATWPGTGHATMFQRGIDGEISSHYASYCIKCHTVGYNTAPPAVNHGFDDVADTLGWVFPDTLIPGNFDSLCANYPELAQLTNIQCENCHGPGADHKGIFMDKIDYTYNSGVCNQCHDAPTHHMKPFEWSYSAHAHSADMSYVVNNESCIICHTAQAFVDSIINGQHASVVELPEPINCILCHDPHDATNEHQVRLYGNISFSDTTLDAKLAALCYQCHNDGGAQPGDKVHHPQAEMLEGFGGYEYPGHSYPSGYHKIATTDKCIDCHMAAADTTIMPDSLIHRVGGHSWEMTVVSGVDTFYNTAGCEFCHGPLPDFNVDGVQTKIDSLLMVLDTILAGMDTSTIEYKQAKFNYDFVVEDGSRGVHNHTYAESLLVTTISNVGVVEGISYPNFIVFKLMQNRPNPFGTITDIRYAAPKEEKVVLTVYDLAGRLVRRLVNTKQKPGYYTVRWDGRDSSGRRVATGIYFYRLETGGFTATKKLTLLK